VSLDTTDPQTIAANVTGGKYRPGQVLEAGGFFVVVNQDGRTTRPLE
jgi:hypothetical protein